MKTIEEIIGQNIRERRKRLKMSQSELAQKAEISLQTVNIIEKAKRPARRGNLESIALALNCQVEDLYRDEAPQKSQRTAQQLVELLEERDARIENLEAQLNHPKVATPAAPYLANATEKQKELIDLVLRADDTAIEGFASQLRHRLSLKSVNKSKRRL